MGVSHGKGETLRVKTSGQGPSIDPSTSRQIHKWDIRSVFLELRGYDRCVEQEHDGFSKRGEHCQSLPDPGVVRTFVRFSRD